MPKSVNHNQKVYWAVESAQDCVSKLESKRTDYYNWLMYTGRRNIMRRSWMYYNSSVIFGTMNVPTGEYGEFTAVHINDYRNILQNVFTMVISQRPAWEPKATNSDAKSMAQCKTAQNVLDNIMRTKKLDEKFFRIVEMAGVLGEGFMEVIWDAHAGRVVIPETDETAAANEGDVAIGVYSTIDVIRDIHAEVFEDSDWVVVRKWKNKYSLANRYPERYDEITSIANNPELGAASVQHFRMYLKNQFDNDRIAYYSFYHKKTESCPDGREIIFINPDLILEDKKLAYRGIPLYRASGGETDGIPTGYTPAWDALNIQETMNGLHTAITSNQKAFAVNNVVAPKGSGFVANQLVGGLNLIEYDAMTGAKPEVLQLLSTAPEVYQYLALLSQKMEQLLQTNAAARGTPPQGVESGSAIAALQSIAVQFNQQLQQKFIDAFEAVGTAIIDLMKVHATSPRLIEMTGKSNRSYIQSFESKDIESIDRIVADVGNPILKTIQGKAQFAQQLTQAGLVVSAQQLLNVWEFGQIDPITDAGTADQINIEKENEYLMEGKAVTALVYDNHKEHILRHLGLIADPAERDQDSPQLHATMDHIGQHMNFLRDPNLQEVFQILGFAPPGGPPQGPAQAPGAAPQQATGPKQHGETGRPAGAGKKPGGLPNEPNLPSIPGTQAPRQPGAANPPKQQWSASQPLSANT